MPAEKPANAVVISTASASTALFDRTGQTGPENHNAVKNVELDVQVLLHHIFTCVWILYTIPLCYSAQPRGRCDSLAVILFPSLCQSPCSYFLYNNATKQIMRKFRALFVRTNFFSWTLQCNRHQMETTFYCGSNITLDEEQSISLADIDSRLGGTQWETKVPMFACNAFLIERVKCALVFGHLPSKVYSDCLFSVLQPVQHL